MMESNAIMEYPTTHVLIDNDVNYLRGLSTILPMDKIYRYFFDAEEALDWINDKTAQDERKAFRLEKNSEDGHAGSFDINVDNIYKSIYNRERFDEISTVLVDYDMPSLNGIELCCSIKNRNIQKVLITGFLGEKEARHALNKGWIDMFLPKGEDSSQKISELIYDADSNYFQQSNGIIRAIILANGGDRMLESESFVSYLKQAYVMSDAVEFYMLSSYGDYLFLNAEGTTWGLSVQDARRRKENFELAQELSVSDNILQRLATGQVLFCHSENDELPEGECWEHYIFPASIVDEDAGLIGSFGKGIFADKSSGIAAFQPTFDESIRDAVNQLNRSQK